MLKPLCAALTAAACLVAGTALADNAPIPCTFCAEWNQPQVPFNIYGNTWYVGVQGLSAVLVTGPQGHILLDAALPESAPLIIKNIESLGFRVQDVKLILNSHAHHDHAGGIAALQKASGAVVMTSASSAKVLADGHTGRDDPQYDPPTNNPIPKVADVKLVTDGQPVSVGPLRLTAHATPGHTPGGTTWTWQSCENGRCLNVVYADSLNAVSTDGYLYTGDASHPDMTASFKASIDKVAQLPCDIAISVHPGFTDVLEKHAARTASHNPFIDAKGCRAYADDANAVLQKRITRERTTGK